MKPKPGSDEAIAQGCICPVHDNNAGKYPPQFFTNAEGEREAGWWIVADCPVHDPDHQPTDPHT